MLKSVDVRHRFTSTPGIDRQTALQCRKDMLLEHDEQRTIESYLNGWRRLWHPIAISEEIATDENGQPHLLEKQVVGESVVLTGVGDRFFALNNHCLHRGAKLSQGWFNVKESRFVCPYHGFEWAINGELGLIPAYQVSGLPCPRSKGWQTRSYQVIERYGVLWVCPTGEPLLPLPEIPPLDDPSLVGGVFVETPYYTGGGRTVENILDPYHIAFTHRGTIGDPKKPESPQVEVKQEQFLYMKFQIDQTQNLSAQGNNDSPEHVPVIYQQWASPNVVFMLKNSPAGRYGLLFLYRVVSPYETVVYRRIFREANISEPEDECIALENKINREDKFIIEQIHPPIIPVSSHFEVHTVYDRATLCYRQYMKSLGFEYF